MRAVIYARYSSDNQREASIEDQVRTCRARAEREHWDILDVYADYAISGATANRPRFQALLADARLARFDVLLAESLDRLSRDQEHIAGLYKQLTFAGMRIVTLAEGEISELHVGLKGTMNALYLKDLADKTRRGLEGRVRAGRSGGGRSFGYGVPRRLGPDGSLVAGAMEIVADEAAIIRRVLAAYAGGQSPRAIAKTLNAEGVPGPRGGRWTASLILGNATRETGLLRNRLYAGERVWNRQRFVKDPATGKRVSRPNPREDWVITQVPALRIVDAAVWEAAQARLAAGHQAVAARTSTHAGDTAADRPFGNRLGSVRRPRWLLSGLVRCGVCGGPMGIVAGEGRLGCTNRHERGTCANSRTVGRERLLGRVLAGLKHRLLAPELVAAFAAAFVAEINAANRDREHRQAKLEQERTTTERQIRNLLELIKDGQGSRSMVDELRGLESRQAELQARIAEAGAPEPLPVLHPNLPELYRRKVEALEEALRDPDAAAAATDALRTLIDAILVYPGERRGEVHVELRGDLAAFLYVGEAATGAAVPVAPAQGASSNAAVLRSGNGCSWDVRGVRGSLVAGAGFEPAAFRL